MQKITRLFLTILTGIVLLSCSLSQLSRQSRSSQLNQELEVDCISRATTVSNVRSNKGNPYIQISESSTGKYYAKMNLRPKNFTHYQRVEFTINPSGSKSGWQVNIGDSKSNNGWAGDGAHQENDSEIQIKDNKLQIYASDKGNSKPLLTTSFDSRINNWFDRTVYFSIENNKVKYNRYYESSKTITNDALFALNGQSDNEGPINYEIYAAFNRVIAGEYRYGTGVGNVTINFYDPISDATWPNDLGVEIESKWMMDESTYQNIISSFIDGSTKYGYEVNVRWGGIPKKYVDVYYDNNSRILKNASHSIRHRQRYKASSYLPSNPTNAQLDAASWRLDWNRVQYKSTPSIISPVWFRDEVTTNVSNSAQAQAIVYGNNSTSTSYIRLVKDHPQFSFTTMKPRAYVYDYRYRIELKKNGVDLYEISLDRVKVRYLVDSTSNTWKTVYFTECELENLKINPTPSDITTMYYLSQQFENEFNLIPSASAKGQY